MTTPKSKKAVKPHGQIRQSQVVTTFGPGSMLDLPKSSVIVAGLEYWDKGEQISELRLVDKLKDYFKKQGIEVPNLALHAPPPDDDDPTSKRKPSIVAWQFPEWFITQTIVPYEYEKGRAGRARRLVHRSALTKGKFIDEDRASQPVVPVRFVQACKKGHIDDIDWYAFVHQGQSDCKLAHRALWMDERGTSGDLAEIVIRCGCKVERPFFEATRMGENPPLGNCNGSRPWLGPFTKEPCGAPNRLLVRSASNAYFPQKINVISLPDRDEAVSERVDQVWEHHLQYVENLDDLKKDRKRRPPVAAALEGLSDEEVFNEIKRRRGDGFTLGAEKSVKEAELETLSASQEEIGTDKPDGRFFARTLPTAQWKDSQKWPWMEVVERVILVHRLREVIAQVGFTRFESSSPDVQGELEMGVVQAPLAREISWLPAIENRGEGFFLQIRSDAIETWLERENVKKRGHKLSAGFACWKADHKQSKRQFPGLPYVFLHSFSHLLISAVSLECGYPASSIRERIYAGGAGYGILLYTGSADSEGTMGGLVEAGRQISRHLKAAFDLARLCSNDPVCAQHIPDNTNETRFLHGAVCHGCLLIPETCCEQHNDFLDRALVVSTVDQLGAEFFAS
ncbi:MAG: DrmB family protein [Isosphaerales bacterium]